MLKIIKLEKYKSHLELKRLIILSKNSNGKIKVEFPRGVKYN